MIEALENRPRPREFRSGRVSHVRAVFPYLIEHRTKQEISEATGLEGDPLTWAIGANYREGYVIRPDSEILGHNHRINTSIARGGILAAIEQYIPLDLTAKQIQALLRAHDNKTFEQEQIAHALARERHRHGLQRPITELTKEAQRDKHRSREELLSIAEKRLEASVFVGANGLKKPKTLQQWTELEEKSSGLMVEILGNKELVPPDILAQRYLATFYQARKLWSEEGNKTLIANFPAEFEEEDPGIVERLKEQREIIIQKTPITTGIINPNTLAENGEIKLGETGWD